MTDAIFENVSWYFGMEVWGLSQIVSQLPEATRMPSLQAD